MMKYSIRAHTTSGWLVRIAFAIMLFISIVRYRSPLMFAILNLLPAILIALPILAYVFWPRRGAATASGGMDAPDEKPKRGESLGELMSILNDEDIDDLRERVKARLEEQIDDANAEEIETFADLLDETKRKRH
jgi:hypothetical protein